MGRVPFAPVAQGLSDFEAKVVTARLGADGILWEIRGIVDSVYPLGGIDVLVPVDELDAARVCLRSSAGPVVGAADDHAADVADVAGAVPDEHGTGPRRRARPRRRRWVTVAVITGVAVFAVARLAAALALSDSRTDCDGGSWRAAAEGLTIRCRP